MCRKALFAGGMCTADDLVDLTGKVAVVTGASPGSLGEATAKLLLGLNATVVVTATKEEKAKEMAAMLGSDCKGYQLNLTDVDSVNTFVDEIAKEFAGKLHILINNAGVHFDLMSHWKVPKLTSESKEIHWHVNYLGTTYLTLKMVPLLERAAEESGSESRIVNVISMLHRLGNVDTILQAFDQDGVVTEKYNSWNAYGQSKLAVLLFAKEMSKEFKAAGKRITSNCLHPGAVFTKVADKGLAEYPRLSAIRSRLSFIEGYFLKTPTEGAQTSLFCAISPRMEGIGGKYFVDCKEKKPKMGENWEEPAAALYAKTKARFDSLQ